MLSLASLVRQPIQCEIFTEHDRYKSEMVDVDDDDDDDDGDGDVDIDDDKYLCVCETSVTFQYDSEIWFFVFFFCLLSF